MQTAPTLYGHDLHLDRAQLEEARREAAAPAPDRPVTQEEEFGEELVPTPRDSLAGRSGKSRFPALARLFGRWNTHGQFEGADVDDELDAIPRDRLLRPLAIVVATAAISFFIVVGLLKLRDSTAVAPPIPAPPPVAARPVAPPAVQPSIPAAPAAPVTATAPARAPSPPSSAVPVRSRPLSEVLERALAQREAPRAAAKRPVQRRPRARVVVPADPDSPMPLSF